MLVLKLKYVDSYLGPLFSETYRCKMLVLKSKSMNSCLDPLFRSIIPRDLSM